MTLSALLTTQKAPTNRHRVVLAQKRESFVSTQISCPASQHEISQSSTASIDEGLYLSYARKPIDSGVGCFNSDSTQDGTWRFWRIRETRIYRARNSMWTRKTCYRYARDNVTSLQCTAKQTAKQTGKTRAAFHSDVPLQRGHKFGNHRGRESQGLK